MNTKAFIILLVGFLALGGSIGGAFAGGIVLGKSQGEEAAASNGITPTLPGSGLPQGFQGQLSTEELEQLRQQFQGLAGRGGGGGGQGFAGGGFGGRGGLTGTIESLEDGSITVVTPQGPLQAGVDADTTIQVFAQGTLADLLIGMRVTVVGERGDDGTVNASSIVVIPEGEGGLFGGGFGGGFGDN